MAVFVITFHMVAILCLVASLVMGILAASFGGMNVDSDTYKAFLLIGVVGVAVATLIEFLIKFVDSMRASLAAHLLALIFVIIGGIGFLVAVIILKPGNNFVAYTVAALVLALQSLIIYLIQWKFSA